MTHTLSASPVFLDTVLTQRDTPTPAPAATPRDAALAIVQTLQTAGHVAYFAGGCVRDTLLGMTPKDYDVATSALPDEVASLFRNTQFVGEAFGVTLVRYKKQAVEVATFRKEWGYTDGRHPTQVEFSDAQNDASRRDFTINGLFENPLATNPANTIIDFVNGQADLQTKTLRAIGNADERFAEDYLRMLRAVRFAARLNFTIEEKTARAITINAGYLGQISRERIGQEIMAMLTPQVTQQATQQPAAPTDTHPIVLAVQLIQSLKLDGPSLNSANISAPLPTLINLTALINQLPSNTDVVQYPICLLAWLLDRRTAADCPPPQAQPLAQSPANYRNWLLGWIHQEAAGVLSRWRRALILSNAVHDTMTSSLSLIVKAANWSDMSVAKQKRLLAHTNWPGAHALLTAMAHQPCLQAILAPINQQSPALIASGLTPEQLITGEDLIKLGQKPGPSFRRLLDQVYDLQLEGRINHKTDAINWLKNHLKL